MLEVKIRENKSDFKTRGSTPIVVMSLLFEIGELRV